MLKTDLTDGLAFVKMHGLGNDFVIIDSRSRAPVMTPELARAIGDRHFGVGFDQLVEMTLTDEADVRVVFWNTDGSQAGACGNATRCVAEVMLQESGQDHVRIQTERGILEAQRQGALISVNMGQAQTAWDEIPLAKALDVTALPIEGAPYAVGMGNPHAVFFVDEISDVSRRGPLVETDPLFPERTNVEFAQVRAHDDIRMRVWERGAGVTLACGSGACATAYAAHAKGLTDAKVNMELDGGWLTLEIKDDGIWMTGPVQHVFEGHLSHDFLSKAQSNG